MASQRRFMQVYVLPGKSSNSMGAEKNPTPHPSSKLNNMWSSKHTIVEKQKVST